MTTYKTKDNTTNWFAFNTLTSKIALILGFFCVFVMIFSIVFFTQSFQNYSYLRHYKDFRLQLRENLYELETKIGQTALHQRAFIITKNPIYQEKRLKLWQNDIKKLIDKINEVDKNIIMQRFETLDQNLLQKVFTETKNFENLQYETAQDYNLLWEKGIIIEGKTYQNNLERLERQRQKITEVVQTLVTDQSKKNNLLFEKIYNNTLNSLYVTLFFGFSLLIFVIVFGQIIYFQIRKAIRKCVLMIEKILLGVFPPPANLLEDEFDEILTGLNTITQNNMQISDFAKKIGERDFEVSFVPVSQEDILGNSLVYMQQQLKGIDEQENKRNWATQGLAKFAEIIRANNKDLYTLADAVLVELIAYLNANQGGFFIANPPENDITKLSLVTSWAYDRKKFLQKDIFIHANNAEGLLGEAFLEQDKIVLTDIPQNYTRITSGLGDDTPKNLVIIPIKSTEKVEGILEIASFQYFEEYQISFVEKLCESLASAIIVIRNMEQTQFLLGELKMQATAMQNQEKELRENVARLNETQQEMQNKQVELENLKNSLEHEIKKRTKDLQGSLIRFDLLNQTASEGLWDMVMPDDGRLDLQTPFYWSPQLVKSLGYEQEEFPDILGSWMSKLHPEDAERVFKEFIAHLKDRTGQTPFQNEHQLLTKSGEYKWFKAYATTLRDAEGKAVRIAGYINDITHKKELDEAMQTLQTQKEALETNNRKMQSNEMVLKKAFEKMKNTEATIKEKNKQLEDNLQLLDDINNNSPSVIYKFFSDLQTQKGYFAFVSKGIINLLGYTDEEYITLTSEQLTESLYVDDRKAYFKSYMNSITKLEKFFWEGRMKQKNGNWIWVQSQSTPRMLPDGNIMSVGSFIDIQQIKKNELEILNKNQQILASEEELRQNMEELQATQEAMQQKQKEIEDSNQKLIQRELVLKKALEKTKENQNQIKKIELQYQDILHHLLGDISLFEENGQIICLSNQIMKSFSEINNNKNTTSFYQKFWEDLDTSHNWEYITQQERQTEDIFIKLPTQNISLFFEKIALNDKNIYLAMNK